MTVLLRPLINEKSTNLIKSSWYTFGVEQDANKYTVARVVAEKFKVDVLEVRIVNLSSKTKAQRTRKGYFNTSPVKKALVKVKKGQKIAIFEMAKADSNEEEVKVVTAEGEHIDTVDTKVKKSLLRGTKVKIEKKQAASEQKQSLSSKTKGDK